MLQEKDLIPILDGYGLSYLDMRGRGGALWLIGQFLPTGPEISCLKNSGIDCHFYPSREKKGKPAWMLTPMKNFDESQSAGQRQQDRISRLEQENRKLRAILRNVCGRR